MVDGLVFSFILYYYFIKDEDCQAVLVAVWAGYTPDDGDEKGR